MSKVIRETVHGADGWNSPLEVDIKVSDPIEVPDEDDQEQIFMEVVTERNELREAVGRLEAEIARLKSGMVPLPEPAPGKIAVKPYTRGKPKPKVPNPPSVQESLPEAATEPQRPVEPVARPICRAEESGQTEASGEATEGLLDTPDSLGPTINLRTTYQQIYDAAKCPHCQKLLKSENPEERCRCGE